MICWTKVEGEKIWLTVYSIDDGRDASCTTAAAAGSRHMLRLTCNDNNDSIELHTTRMPPQATDSTNAVSYSPALRYCTFALIFPYSRCVTGSYFAGLPSPIQTGKHSTTLSGSALTKYGIEYLALVIRCEPSNLSDKGGRVTR